MALASKHRLPISQANPDSVVVESYRTLSANLQFSTHLTACSSVLIASSSPGEGRTLTAANLAIVSAQEGKKVLLIDTDLRNPSLHLQFRIPNVIGLSTMVRKSTLDPGAIVETGTPGLSIISSGPKPSNPLELLAGLNFKQIVAEAKNQFDMIIFDTPPVLAVTDALLLSRVADGVLLVVNTRKTQRSTVQKTIKALQQVNSPLLGCVLNRTSKPSDRHSYLRHSSSYKAEQAGNVQTQEQPSIPLNNQPTTNL